MMEVDHASVPREEKYRGFGGVRKHFNDFFVYFLKIDREGDWKHVLRGLYRYTEYAIEDQRKCEQEGIHRPRNRLCGEPARGWETGIILREVVVIATWRKKGGKRGGLSSLSLIPRCVRGKPL